LTVNVQQGSLEIAGVRGRYGGILVVETPKYPHISSLPRRFPMIRKFPSITFKKQSTIRKTNVQ
jgi:hypothetical protein